MTPARTTDRYLHPYRGTRRLGVVMLVVTNLAFLGVPELTRILVDSVGHVPRERIAVEAALLIGFAIVVAATRIASRILIFNAGRAAEFDLRSHLFGQVMALSPSYYRVHATGDVMSRLTNDVQAVRGMWGPGLLNLSNAVVAFGVVLTAMVVHDPIVTLWAIIPFPLIYIVGQAFSRRLYKTLQGVQGELGTLSAQLQESIGAIQVIKTYDLEGVRRDKFVAQSERLSRANMDAAKVRIQLGPTLNTLAAFGVGILILFGGRAMIAHDMTKGEVVAMSGYIARLVWPTLTFGFTLAVMQRGRAAWSRIAVLLDAKPEIADGPLPAPPPTTSPVRIEVRSLTITLGSRTILDDVSFILEPSSITAIVGRTGAGKSTLVEALCRSLYVPPDSVFFDGRDVTALPADAIRAQIGYAPQEAFLFSTTLADNIAMGFGSGRASSMQVSRADVATTLDDARVRAAAEAAGLARDLARMPEGLSTIVGERGITLSGGQRQRVALARALAAAPRLLVLDDSLSSVDAETEARILTNLEAVMHGRTTVLISHRIAAIKSADQILVLDQGKIVARGTHDDLLADGGLYAQLYRTQLDVGELPA
ncbi:MAG: ABC transporter ATP-binding protein [Proteobacteria bacterium]|nr:ABC transporter ATP-binding protein [Pseudomonadota bacterium]